MSECFAWDDNSKGCSATLNKCDGMNRLCAFYKTRKEQEEGQKKAFQRLAKVNPALLKSYHPGINPEDYGADISIDDGYFVKVNVKRILELIEALDLTVSEFERWAGLNERHIHKLKQRMDFNGISRCRPEHAMRICRTLGEDIRVK